MSFKTLSIGLLSLFLLFRVLLKEGENGKDSGKNNLKAFRVLGTAFRMESRRTFVTPQQLRILSLSNKNFIFYFVFAPS